MILSQYRRENVRVGKTCVILLGGLPISVRVFCRIELSGEVKYSGFVGQKAVSFSPEDVLEVED